MFLSASAMKSHALEETLSRQCCYKFLSESSKQGDFVAHCSEGSEVHKTSAILVRVSFPLSLEMRHCKMRSRQYHEERNWHVHLLSPSLAVGIWPLWCLLRMQTCHSWEYSETHSGHAPAVTEWACPTRDSEDSTVLSTQNRTYCREGKKATVL